VNKIVPFVTNATFLVENLTVIKEQKWLWIHTWPSFTAYQLLFLMLLFGCLSSPLTVNLFTLQFSVAAF